MVAFQPRPYQVKCKEAILAAFQSHKSVAVELATGLGKTEIFVDLARDWEDGRVLIMANRKELVSQAAKKIRQRAGYTPDIEQGNLWANESEWGRTHIVVASKDSLHRSRLERFRDIGLLITDEAHHFGVNNRSYRHIEEFLREKNPELRHLGVSATLKRHDKSAMRQVFDTCCFQMGILEGINDGWLVPASVSCKQIVSMDFSDCTLSKKGDFKEDQISKIIEQDAPLHEIAATAIQEGAASLKTLVFVPSVDSAELLAEIFNRGYGARAGWVCGDKKRVSDERRAEVLDAFRAGDLNILVNVGVLTEGFDEPTIEHIVMARPTASMPLFAQMLGRGTRPLPGVVDFPDSTAERRKECIAISRKPVIRVTDLVDLSMRHKIITSADVLSGTDDAKLLEKIKESIRGAHGPVSIPAEVAKAKHELDEERRKREEEAELRRQERAQLHAQVEYRSVSVDPFSTTSSYGGTKGAKRVVMPFGKHKGTPLPEVPADYLRWIREKQKVQKWLEKAIDADLNRRSGKSLFQESPAPGGCTPQQAKVLSRHGYSVDVSYAEAARCIGEINKKLRKVSA